MIEVKALDGAPSGAQCTVSALRKAGQDRRKDWRVRAISFQMAEVAVLSELFQEILGAISTPRLPSSAQC
jgi:hypothetical protein